jgi:hypothetical protein
MKGKINLFTDILSYNLPDLNNDNDNTGKNTTKKVITPKFTLCIILSNPDLNK